jgi:hypothetical protein
MTGSAVIDPTGTYRYLLTREVGEAANRILWVMLNPSTADASRDDPTIRRCIGFSKRWGYGVMHVCNIFALRSTSPKALYTHADPVGPDNDDAIRVEALRAATVVCAWGAHGELHDRGRQVHAMLRQMKVAPIVLRLTKGGQPVHPLYQPNDAQTSLWLP